MKLVEKKCPNCGASLEFSETDKSCQCQYCHRAFEIERDDKINATSFEEQFNLSELQKPFQAFTIIIIIFIFSVSLLIIGSIIFSIQHNSVKNKGEIVDKEKDSNQKNNLLEDISELSNKDFDAIDNQATININQVGEGANDTNHSYSITGSIRRELLYVAYKEGSNYVIPIYKATYHDFFHQENQYTVYIPIVFENIEKDVVFSLGNAKIDAPEYYFDDEHSSYTYGYASLEDACNNVLNPLGEEYKITSKYESR